MYRRMLFSIGVVLLVCPLAFGGSLMDLMQEYAIGATDMISRVGPTSSAQYRLSTGVGHTQTDVDSMGGVGTQAEGGQLDQSAQTSGHGGRTSVTNVALAAGSQELHLGSPHEVGEAASLVLGTEVIKECGQATASSDQTYEGGQTQAIVTDQGSTTESQAINAERSAQVDGETCSDAGVVSALAIGAQQYNKNNPCDCECPTCETLLPSIWDLLP